MRLNITHETRYDYTPAVEVAQHMAYLCPLDHDNQRLLAYTLEIHPSPSCLRTSRDVFGNVRHFFSLQSPHTTLQVVARSQVQTTAGELPDSQLPWEAARAHYHYRAGAPYDPACEFSFASPHCPHDAAFAAYAQPSFAPGTRLLAGACHLMQRIHSDFVYESQSTQVNTPALQALAQRKGVCQDFAHIMLASLRSLGLAARYVSGYLLTQAPPGVDKLIGSDASHAWVAVHVPDLPPGQRWCHLDPTNNRCGWHLPGEDYVALATGRDFSDVSPMRGVIHGGAHHTLHVGVSVEPPALV